MHAQSYLNFNGQCEEALEFYRNALGAEIEMLMRFKEAPPNPEAKMPAGSAEKVMHSSFRVGDTTILATDAECSGHPQFQGFSLCLTPASAAEAEKLFGALAKGGKVKIPLTKTFFSPCFGEVSDRFGVNWMFYVSQ